MKAVSQSEFNVPAVSCPRRKGGAQTWAGQTGLRKLNRILNVLRRSSEAMVHAERQVDYLAEVCKIITDDCGHAMAWISFTEGADPKAGRRVGYVGHARGAPKTWRLAWADTQGGHREVGTTVCTGQPGSSPAPANDPPFGLWREEALKHGYASSVAIPLLANQRALGAITIYSRQPAAFPDDEVKLLRELARDAAYGIAAIHQRKAHAKLEEAPRKSEESNRAGLDRLVVERTAQLRNAYERRRLGSRSSTSSPVG